MNARIKTMIFVILITLLGTPGLVFGQRYPFFVQPISVEDLKPMADELKLSPTQVEVVIGFHETYGEQFNGMHINQTFTGVAFAFPR